jgi:hypothetical protein
MSITQFGEYRPLVDQPEMGRSERDGGIGTAHDPQDGP